MKDKDGNFAFFGMRHHCRNLERADRFLRGPRQPPAACPCLKKAKTSKKNSELARCKQFGVIIVGLAFYRLIHLPNQKRCNQIAVPMTGPRLILSG